MKKDQMPERFPEEDPIQRVIRDLQEFRKDHSLTRDEMAYLLRVSSHTITKWEQGCYPRSQPRSRAAILAFREIQKSPDALLWARLLPLRALTACRIDDTTKDLREYATRLLEITPSPERFLQRLRALLEESARDLLDRLTADASKQEEDA